MNRPRQPLTPRDGPYLMGLVLVVGYVAVCVLVLLGLWLAIAVLGAVLQETRP